MTKSVPREGDALALLSQVKAERDRERQRADDNWQTCEDLRAAMLDAEASPAVAVIRATVRGIKVLRKDQALAPMTTHEQPPDTALPWYERMASQLGSLQMARLRGDQQLVEVAQYWLRQIAEDHWREIVAAGRAAARGADAAVSAKQSEQPDDSAEAN